MFKSGLLWQFRYCTLASLRNGEVVVLSEPFGLSHCVTPYDVAAFVGLKVPYSTSRDTPSSFKKSTLPYP